MVGKALFAILAFVAEDSEGVGALSPDVWEKGFLKMCAGGQVLLEQSEQGKEGGPEAGRRRRVESRERRAPVPAVHLMRFGILSRGAT